MGFETCAHIIAQPWLWIYPWDGGEAGDHVVAGRDWKGIKTARDQKCVSVWCAVLTEYIAYPTLWVEANRFARIFRIISVDAIYSEKSKSVSVIVLL